MRAGNTIRGEGRIIRNPWPWRCLTRAKRGTAERRKLEWIASASSRCSSVDAQSEKRAAVRHVMVFAAATITRARRWGSHLAQERMSTSGIREYWARIRRWNPQSRCTEPCALKRLACSPNLNGNHAACLCSRIDLLSGGCALYAGSCARREPLAARADERKRRALSASSGRRCRAARHVRARSDSPNGTRTEPGQTRARLSVYYRIGAT